MAIEIGEEFITECPDDCDGCSCHSNPPCSHCTTHVHARSDNPWECEIKIEGDEFLVQKAIEQIKWVCKDLELTKCDEGVMYEVGY